MPLLYLLERANLLRIPPLKPSVCREQWEELLEPEGIEFFQIIQGLQFEPKRPWQFRGEEAK